MTVSRWCSLVACGALVLGSFELARSFPPAAESREASPLGPLVADPEGILDLPAGFSYRIIARTGQEMDDGFLVPARPDGMAAFPGPGGLIIVIRNHELLPYQVGAFGEDNSRYREADRGKFYDPGFGQRPIPGGTTTFLFDTSTQEVTRQFLSLAGTVQNCSGGPTPWNTWISCEETVQKAAERPRFVTEKDHGYNFEVPARSEIGLVDPVPLKAMGRFVHEAVAVDPRTGIVYQTEDVSDGLIYRFIPDQPGRLQEGGRLQALAIAKKPGKDTRNWTRRGLPIRNGEPMAVEWIDLDDVESPEGDLRHRGYRAGAARFGGGEGMFAGNGAIYFVCSVGGRKRMGQIWRYVPSPAEGTGAERENPGMLELLAEPNDPAVLRNADNITVAPWGDLVLCEDHSGDGVRLLGFTAARGFYTIALHHLRTEFTGACFSPDGSTLFVNMQDAGLTVAIQGPWPKAPGMGGGRTPGAGGDGEPQ